MTFEVRLRIDTPTEAEYYRHGGVLNFVLRQLAAAASAFDRVRVAAASTLS